MVRRRTGKCASSQKDLQQKQETTQKLPGRKFEFARKKETSTDNNSSACLFLTTQKVTHVTKSKKKTELTDAPDSNPFEKLPQYKWKSRTWIFKLYDEGVKLDYDGFFDVTPELVADQITDTMCELQGTVEENESTVIEGCCGLGGNTISFAKRFHRVVGIDVNKDRLESAQYNAKLYGVDEKIEWLQDNVITMDISNQQTHMWGFVAPPWGGQAFKKQAVFKMADISEIDNLSLIRAVGKMSENLCLFLPPNQDFNELVDLAQDLHKHVYILKHNFHYSNSRKHKVTWNYCLSIVQLFQCSAFYFLSEKTLLRQQPQFLSFLARETLMQLKEPSRLAEKMIFLISNLGIRTFLDLVNEAILVDSSGGMFRIDDPTKLRSLGGIFFYLVKQKHAELLKTFEKQSKNHAEKSAIVA